MCYTSIMSKKEFTLTIRKLQFKFFGRILLNILLAICVLNFGKFIYQEHNKLQKIDNCSVNIVQDKHL